MSAPSKTNIELANTIKNEIAAGSSSTDLSDSIVELISRFNEVANELMKTQRELATLKSTTAATPTPAPPVIVTPSLTVSKVKV